MEKVAKISPFRLASLLRLERNPVAALQLFRRPSSSPKPFQRTVKIYDIIVCKLAKSKMFTEMQQVLDEMQKETKLVFKEALFCRVITIYGRTHMPGSAIDIYRKIPSFRCRRTIRSFNTLLHALLDCGENDRVRELLSEIDDGDDEGLQPDACTFNILIRACVSSGSMKNAWDLFDEMRERKIRPSVVTFGTLIPALCDSSNLDDALELKEEMVGVFNIKPNVYIYTSLIKALCKNNELDSALKLKDEMVEDKEIVLDSALFSTLIRAMFKAGRKEEVVGMLEEMKVVGVKPDTVTYNAMIAGFCEAKMLDTAAEVLNEMGKKKCKPDIVSYNIIISGLCRDGRWRDARDLFDDLPRRECRPDVVSYRTLFDGMVDGGELREAALLLDEMVFNGYAPGGNSVRKFVEGLLQGGCEASLVSSALCTLGKSNVVELELWQTAVGCLLLESEMLKMNTVMELLAD